VGPRLTQHEPFTVMGLLTRVRRGTETPALFAGIWSGFESRRRELEALAPGDAYLGVSFPTADESVTDYVAGTKVAADAPVLEGFVTRTVGGGRSAVFESPVEAIGDTCRHIFSAWLPGAGVQLDPTAPVFEEYPRSDTTGPVRIHVPIRERLD
jgi:predicted transcriptional regulator YdeE